MANTNTTSVTDLLKNVYANYKENQQNLSHMSYDKIGKSSKKYNAGGKGFFGGINESGNESGGAINENESFRTIDSENYSQYRVLPKVQVWPIEISGLVAEAGNEDAEAFADVLVDALDMARERCLKDLNRQFFGKGNGLLGSPSAAAASNVTSFAVDSAQYFRANMVIDIYNGATKTIDSLRISEVDKVAGVLYFATSIGVAVDTTFEIVKENIRDSAPTDGKEHMGLRGIIDDATELTTFENLSAADKRIWRAIRINASSANLTSDLLQRLLDDVKILGGKSPDLILMHPKQRRKYLDIVVPQKRYMDGKMDAGHSSLSFNGMELTLDEDCQDSVVYAVNRSHLHRYVVKDLGMGTLEDSGEFLRLSNSDVYQAFWRLYGNFGTDKRNAHGKIVSLGKPNGVS